MSKMETPSGMNKGRTDLVLPLEEDKIHKGRSNSEPPWKRAIFINGVANHHPKSKEEKMMTG